MAAAQRFQERLQAQFRQAGARILQLEGLNAQKDDLLAQKDAHLASMNAQIQRLMANASTTNNGNQNMTLAVQAQINQANSRAMNAENSHKSSVTRFNIVHAQLQKKIQQLQQQNQQLRKENAILKKQGGGADKAEIERMSKAYKSLERQFEAEKRHGAKGTSCPPASKGKAAMTYGADDDEDDEEPRYVFDSFHCVNLILTIFSASWMKQEPVDKPEAPPTVPEQPQPPPPAMMAPPKPVSWSSFVPPGSSRNSLAGQQSPQPPPHLQPSIPIRPRTASVSSSTRTPLTIPASPHVLSNEMRPAFQMPTSALSLKQERTGSWINSYPYPREDPRQSPHMPTPAQSIRQGSTASETIFSQHPRANAVDLTSDQPEPRSGKRRRQSEQDKVKGELKGLEINDAKSRASLDMKNPKSRTRFGSKNSTQKEVIEVDTPSPPPPSKRPRNDIYNPSTPIPSPTDSPTSSTHSGDLEDRFPFKAVISHNNDDQGSITFLDSQKDLADEAAVLWERIYAVHELWEEAKGEYWTHEFKHKMKDVDCKQCVSSKLRIEGR